MKRTMKAAVGAVPLLVLAHVASAGEPVQLSDEQMDGVTASGSAFALASANAIGNPVATFTDAFAQVEVVASATGQVTNINLVLSQSQASSQSFAN